MNEPILKFYDDSDYEKALQFLTVSENHTVLRKINCPNPSQINIPNQNNNDKVVEQGKSKAKYLSNFACRLGPCNLNETLDDAGAQ